MAVDDDHKNLMSYLRQADATFRNGFESEELKQIFLRNTLEEISGCEVKFCLQKSFSFILEGMIEEAELDPILNFYNGLKNNWINIATSPAGCHVLQTICRRIIMCVDKSEMKSLEVTQKLEALPLIVEFDSESIVSAMRDVHCTHAFRSHMQMLGGVVLTAPNIRNSTTKEVKLSKEVIPKGFIKKLRGLCRSMCDITEKKFLELLSDAHAAPCITCILEVLSKRKLPKTLSHLCGKILSCCDIKTSLILFKDRHASHIFESVLRYGDSKSKREVQNVLCSDGKTFFDLCAHPTANFVVQNFISCADDDQQFREVFQFISEGLEDILASQNYGIVLRICEQCLKFTSCQKSFYDGMLKAFHCERIEDRAAIVILFATLRTHDSYLKETEIKKVEYHGSVLLQTLLNFENIGLLVKSMCEMSVQNLLILSCDSSGSHFIDAFFASDKVKFRKKKELVEKIGDDILRMACDKYGSRVLENIWDKSDISIKRLLAQFLVKSSDALSECDFGKFILKKFQIKRFETRLQEWESIQKSRSNKRKLFDGIAAGSKHLKTKRK